MLIFLLKKNSGTLGALEAQKTVLRITMLRKNSETEGKVQNNYFK